MQSHFVLLLLFSDASCLIQFTVAIQKIVFRPGNWVSRATNVVLVVIRFATATAAAATGRTRLAAWAGCV